MKRRLLYIISFPFLAGVFLASIIHIDRSVSFLVVLVAIVTAIYAFVARFYDEKSHWRIFLLISIVVITFAFGLIRTTTSLPVHLESYGNETKFDATIVTYPRDTSSGQSFVISPIGENSRKRILVRASRYPEYEYGNVISVSGRIDQPKNFEIYDGGPIFDYVSYLAKDGVVGIMRHPEIKPLSDDGGNILSRSLYVLRDIFSRGLENAIREPQSSLALGILVGDTSSFGKEMSDVFRRAGLSHLVALSGYNVTVIAEWFMAIFSYISISLSPVFGSLSIILFAVMTGGSATVIRASIMALLLIMAKRSARRYDVSRALLFAVFVMVLHNPLILTADVSFHLSVLAMIGLIYVSPIISSRISFVTERFALRDIVATTIGVQIFLTPYIMYAMGTFSLSGFISNILVLPVVPYAMALSFVAGFIGMIFPLLSLPFGFIADVVLSYIINVAEYSSSFAISAIDISIPGYITFCIYLAISVYLIKRYRKYPTLEREINSRTHLLS